jgi:Zn-dependent protease
MILVAAAGPGINFALALVSALLLHLTGIFPEPLAIWLVCNLSNSVLVNLLLAVFNMLPLPPLDGGRVAVGLLPHRLAVPLARLERYGLFILIGAIFLLPMLGRQLGVELNVFRWAILGPVEWMWPFFWDLGGGTLRLCL